MPMWISWLKPERIWNACDPDTPEGREAIDIAKKDLAKKFNIPPDKIPGFKVEPAWKKE